mmetsp:Transcript_65400/g.179458  ORF Transcript_65400/g.179458 Transcript_65400/m.179458 type:complete len:283 (-) Transcript_65400:528-1376(-)
MRALSPALSLFVIGWLHKAIEEIVLTSQFHRQRFALLHTLGKCALRMRHARAQVVLVYTQLRTQANRELDSNLTVRYRACRRLRDREWAGNIDRAIGTLLKGAIGVASDVSLAHEPVEPHLVIGRPALSCRRLNLSELNAVRVVFLRIALHSNTDVLRVRPWLDHTHVDGEALDVVRDAMGCTPRRCLDTHECEELAGARRHRSEEEAEADVLLHLLPQCLHLLDALLIGGEAESSLELLFAVTSRSPFDHAKIQRIVLSLVIIFGVVVLLLLVLSAGQVGL